MEGHAVGQGRATAACGTKRKKGLRGTVTRAWGYLLIAVAEVRRTVVRAWLAVYHLSQECSGHEQSRIGGRWAGGLDREAEVLSIGVRLVAIDGAKGVRDRVREGGRSKDNRRRIAMTLGGGWQLTTTQRRERATGLATAPTQPQNQANARRAFRHDPTAATRAPLPLRISSQQV